MAQGGDHSKGKGQETEAALAAALRANLQRRKAGSAKPSATEPGSKAKAQKRS